MNKKLLNQLLALAIAGASVSALADITIGVTLSVTGPAASLGIPEKNTIALAPFAPAADKAAWVFQTPQAFGIMASSIVGHMSANGVRTVAFIGYSDLYGELWLRELNNVVGPKGIRVIDVERFNRTDTSVTGPVLVTEQLPDSHPSKKPALEFISAYENANGAGSRSTFGAHAWDAELLLQRAVPEALKKAKPGTPEFRVALRDALENVKDLAATHGVLSFSATDHKGLDSRASVLIRIDNGAWKVVR